MTSSGRMWPFVVAMGLGLMGQPAAAQEPMPEVAAQPIALAEADIQDKPAPKRARVLKVYDGDTLTLEGDERVRVLYINTPEKREELGPEAGDFVRKLLLFREVELVYSSDRQRDGYGRLLAEVYFKGVSLEEHLLRNGFAHLFLIAPGKPPPNFEKLLAAQEEARVHKRGIWATDRYSGTLHITSYHANARGDDRTNLNGEYLRIANITTEDLNVGGYTMTSEHGRELVFPEFVIPAGYSFTLVTGPGENNDDVESGSLKLFWPSKYPIWKNSGDSATLRNVDGVVMDKVVHAPKRK